MKTPEICGACGSPIEICEDCGGKRCSDACPDREEDGCVCALEDEDDE